VTNAVLRKASRPVLTVCGAAEPPDADGPPFRRILCAVDFQRPSEHGLRFAWTLAEEADAEITLLHVVEPFFEDEFAKRTHVTVADYRRFLETQLAARLGQLIPAGAAEACRPREVVRLGAPGEEITREATAFGADLVVMGVHGGRGPLDRLVFGSTAQQVLRHTKCPVLTVGDPRPAASAREAVAEAAAPGDGGR
jgi:nucleotide-binding universal stress UspA family protein